MSNNPNVLSLIREITFDPAVNHLVSRPVTEYTELHNATFVPPNTAVTLNPGTTKPMPVGVSHCHVAVTTLMCVLHADDNQNSLVVLHVTAPNVFVT